MNAVAAKQAKVEPIRKQLTVEAPQERAFRVFTERFDAWWPRSHSIGGAPMKQAILEQKTGGRWYERAEDGKECDWGKVLVWDPPRRVVVSWQITNDWKYDPTLVTEVEVTFTPDGPTRTRVELEHRDLERYGAAAEEARKVLASPGGWPGLLDMYRPPAAQR